MKDILVPISDPHDAAWAAEQAIARCGKEPACVHLLNVQRPLPRHVAQFFGRNDLRDFHRDAGMGVLEPAIRLLDAAGIPHEDHVLVGSPARTIVHFAEQLQCSEVVLDDEPEGLLSSLGLGSIGSQVRHLRQSHAAAPLAQGASTA